MDHEYLLSRDLLSEVDVPERGIIRHTLVNDEHTRMILFAFAPGEELAAHTAPLPATIQILRGEGTLTVGSNSFAALPGCLVHMRPQVVHAVVAHTALHMLLTLNKAAKASAATPGNL